MIDMTKLSEYLLSENRNIVTLSLDDIERIIETKLPEIAKKQPRWWWNTKNSRTAQAWLSVGYHTYNMADMLHTNNISFRKSVNAYEENESRDNSVFKRIVVWYTNMEISLFRKILAMGIPLFYIFIFIAAFQVNKTYDLRIGIIIILSLLLLLIAILLFLMFVTWKRMKNKKMTDDLKRFSIFVGLEILIFVTTSIMGYAFVYYMIPLIVPNEYTINCIHFTYKGYVSKGNADGVGRMLYWSGDIYDGEFQNGLHWGHGKYTYKNGNIYEGNFISGKMHGDGVYTFFDSKVYTGTFTKGEITGYGSIKYKSDVAGTYIGFVKEGLRSGIGTQQISNGCRYEGEWQDDDKHGKGTMYFPNGDKYEGTWINGYIDQGEALHTFSDGRTKQRFMYPFIELVGINDIVSIGKISNIHDNSRLEPELDPFEVYDQRDLTPPLVEGEDLRWYGEYESKSAWLFRKLYNDCLNGYNEVSFFGNNEFGFGGDHYYGEFLNGTMHGYGMMLFKDESGNGEVNQVYEGGWEDGLRSGHGILRDKCGDVFEGEWLNDELNGQGIYFLNDGRYIEAIWSADFKKSGYGAFNFPDGMRWEGTWQGDQFKGEGKIIDPSGDVTQYFWEGDEINYSR